MKPKILLAVISLGLVVAVTPAFAQQPPQHPPTQQPGSGHEMKQIKADGDAEVIALLMAIDRGEIAAAKAALNKKGSSEVMAFARIMQTEHSRHLELTQQLGQQIDIDPQTTDNVTQLEEESQSHLSLLNSMSGKEFDRAFMQHMVDDHTKALNMIDSHLLKAAKNEQLIAHLRTTRTAVSTHLDEAKRILGTLGGSITR